jgi:plastocyanin
MCRRRVLEVAVAVTAMVGGALVAAPALGSGEASKTATKRVVVMDNFFEPRSVNIRKNDRVVWVWKGDNSHNITFTKVPKSVSKKGASTRRKGRWSRKFRKRGFYKYICTIHSGQRGSIEVGPAVPVVDALRPEAPSTGGRE